MQNSDVNFCSCYGVACVLEKFVGTTIQLLSVYIIRIIQRRNIRYTVLDGETILSTMRVLAGSLNLIEYRSI